MIAALMCPVQRLKKRIIRIMQLNRSIFPFSNIALQSGYEFSKAPFSPFSFCSSFAQVHNQWQFAQKDILWLQRLFLCLSQGPKHRTAHRVDLSVFFGTECCFVLSTSSFETWGKHSSGWDLDFNLREPTTLGFRRSC